MTLRLGINGFGRIGRAIFRLAHLDPDVQVVQVNDLSSGDVLGHMLKYDGVHGTFPPKVETAEKSFTVDGKKVLCTLASETKDLHWGDAGVDIVLECTGRYRDRAHGQGHLDQGAKKVIVSAPVQGVDVTIVMGVNEKDYNPKQHHVASNASCTTNCLAPVVKVLDEKLGIIQGFMTTIHSFTMDQRLLDGAHKDLRRSRAATLNQIPTTTGAAKAIGLVLPKLKGKLDGISVRVPTPNVSLVDFVGQMEKSCTVDQVNEFFIEAAKGSLKGILDFSHELLVSSDYNGSKFSAVVDGLSTNVLGGKLVKVLAWYDNETAFSQRMIDLAKYMSRTVG